LESLRLLAAEPPGTNIEVSPDSVLGKESVWRQRGNEFCITAEWASSEPRGMLFQVKSSKKGGTLHFDLLGGSAGLIQEKKAEIFSQSMARTAYYQLTPQALRQASQLSAQMNRFGEGFPTFLDDINRSSRIAFSELEKEFYSRFPYYEMIILGKTNVPEKRGGADGRFEFIMKDAFKLSFRSVNGEILGSASVSDGVMLSLAYVAICNQPEPPKILLIEEPENGVHYASLQAIVSTLRELTKKKDVQVILTTHSPYLLDLVEPDEVYLFSKDQIGAGQVKRMSDYPEVDEMKKHFNTGEIWTNLLDKDLLGTEGKGR
jgi:hypothetical protein